MTRGRFSTLLFSAVLFACCLSTEARAQSWDRPYYGGYHASTPYEGYARGMADMTRSAGLANLLDAQAATVAQDARTKALHNDVLATETFYNKKAIRKSYLDANRRPALTTDQAALISRSRLPDPLTYDQYDPVTGQILWPAALRSAPFEPYRDQLDRLFATRAANGGETSLADQLTIQEVADEMTDQLKRRIQDLPTHAYLQARGFISSLSFEGRS